MATSTPLDAGNLALDFLNTLGITEGELRDRVPAPGTLLNWLGSAGVLTREQHQALEVSPPDARLLLGEAQRLRAVLGAGVEAAAAGTPVPTRVVLGLNRVLAARRRAQRVRSTDEGLALESVEEWLAPEGLLAPVAEAAVRLLGGAPPSRIRRCHAEDCRLWFLDGSKNGSRKWCSMARCGNRAKAAAHYRRSRT